MNERTLSIFPQAKIGANLVDVIKTIKADMSDEDIARLISVVRGIETAEIQLKISGEHYCAANVYIPTNKEHLIFLRNITSEVEIDRLKDTALAVVSHELRTPLTAIRGHAEIAIREPDTAVANANRILLNTQRLLIMVENLLSQARLRTGKIKNTPGPTSVETVFRVVYSLLASQAKEKCLTFEMNVEEELPVLMMDAVLLQQILTNLAGNAIKFTKQGTVEALKTA
jgi:signal transduction histidine kinase